MKKILALLLAMLLTLSGVALAEEPLAEEVTAVQTEEPSSEEMPAEEAQAEEAPAEATEEMPAEQPAYDQLVVGSTTALSGSFFTEMWGNNTSDIDVRMLLHGYNLMEWQSATGAYGLDNSVASGLVVTDDPEGNRTYTVALYEDLYYSDGTQITAWDYAFSILLSVAPEVAAIGGQTVDSDYILGIEEYKSGEATALAGVRVLSDFMLSITVSAEYRPFFYELALLDYSPYPIHVIAPGCEVADDGEGVYIRNIPDEDGTVEEEPIFTAELLQETILDPQTGYLSHPSVVSGPYKLVSFDWETREAEFEINEYYKGNSSGQVPVVPKLIYRTVSNETMMDELASGEVNLLNKCVNADAIDAGMQLTADGQYGVANYPRSGYSFVSFCCEQTAMSSQSVRQAIAHCMDKSTLVTDYVRNYGVAVDGYYGIGQWIYQLVSGTLAAPVEAPAEDATEEELAAYEETVAGWDALTMENIPTYAFDLEAATALLVEDGWTLNRDGGEFDPEVDDVRCKEIDGEQVALELTLIYPEGNAIAEGLQTTFADNLAQVGIQLTLEALPMTELLDVYYRNVERDCDMIYLATNFATVFEPSSTYNPADAYQGSSNRSGIVDEELYQLAVDMRQTEPGDVLTYCQKWVAFQERWAEVLPAIPVYSNVYFDFYTNTLHDYAVSSNLTWTQAVVGSYLGDAAQVEEEQAAEEMEDGAVIIED